MDGLGILIPLAPFIMVAAIVCIPAWLRSRERQEMQATVRAAIEKGQPLPPELIEAMTKEAKPGRVSSRLRDIRIGIIWLAIGLGFALLGTLISFEESDALYPMLGTASIPAVIGLAYIVLSFFNPNKGDQV